VFINNPSLLTICPFIIAMFSFRRKPKKIPDAPCIRTSPSLPELNSQGILPWPEDLVDLAAIQQSPQSDVVPPQGAAKISFQRDQGPIPFHKPFRPSTEKVDGTSSKPSVLFMPKTPPSAFDKTVRPLSAARYSQRRARIPPTFNLMVSFSRCLRIYYPWIIFFGLCS
jgi:hypothetical protein